MSCAGWTAWQHLHLQASHVMMKAWNDNPCVTGTAQGNRVSTHTLAEANAYCVTIMQVLSGSGRCALHLCQACMTDALEQTSGCVKH